MDRISTIREVSLYLIFLFILAVFIDGSIQRRRLRQEQSRAAAESESLTIEIESVSRDCKLMEQKNGQLEIALAAAELAEQHVEKIAAKTKRSLEYYRSLCGIDEHLGERSSEKPLIREEGTYRTFRSSGNSACSAPILYGEENCFRPPGLTLHSRKFEANGLSCGSGHFE
jgi:hypothetical protein